MMMHLYEALTYSLIIVGAIFVWEFFGFVALSFVDIPDGKIHKWALDCPISFRYHLTMILWPVVIWAAKKRPVE